MDAHDERGTLAERLEALSLRIEENNPSDALLREPGVRAMTATVRVPRAFFDDHASRDLDTPKVLSSTKRHYVIAADDPAIPELLNDAEFYADAYGPDMGIGFKSSARATVKAIRAATHGDEPR